MSRTLLTAAFLAVPVGAAAGGERGAAPKGPPPQVMILHVERDGTQYIQQMMMAAEPRQEAYKVKVGNREEVRTRTVYVQIPKWIRVGLTDKQVEVFDATGKRLVGADIPKFLKPVPVLVSADGKPVDPLYLRLVRPDTLVVVTPHLVAQPVMPVPIPSKEMPDKGLPVPKG
jgi:hypothetical protein